MSNEAAKAEAFVARLLANPALSDQNPLQKEEQILQFLNANSHQLYPTLSSANFFPGMEWQQIWGFLHQALTKSTDAVLVPLLRRTVQEQLDLSYISFMRQQAVGQDKVKEALFQFLAHSLSHYETRRELIGSLNAILFKGDEKYIDQVYLRKEYIHFELTKVQRLKMSKEEVKYLIRTCLLLRPAVFSLFASSGNSDRHAGLLPAQSADRVLEAMTQRLKLIPDQIHRSTVNSTVSFLENRFIEATARMTAILSAMYRSYRGNITVDRGADTQDKSWISTARRNFKFFGYDIKLLDELYKIAAENGW